MPVDVVCVHMNKMNTLQRSLNGLAPELKTRWNVLSLGAGVQSSVLALMAAEGEISPMPDFAVFADTQAEPASVYEWLNWLETKLPFPVYRVTKGSLEESILELRKAKDGRMWVKSGLPTFTLSPDGTRGMIPNRSCTADFKISEILKCVRKKCEIKRGQKEVTVTQWIGISMDEIQRMKPSREAWSQHRWPLVEREMRREHCLEWMKNRGYPLPPRSSCVFCPFHSDAEWRRLKNEEPLDFERAVAFEKKFQAVKEKADEKKAIPFLHRSCNPLDKIDFRNDYDMGQISLFTNECEGICGV